MGPMLFACLLSLVLSLSLVQCAIQNDYLPEQLWGSASASRLKDQAYTSKFVGGVVNGTLDPDFYAKYQVQDAYWVLNVGYVWGNVSKVASNTDLRSFATSKNASWVEYGIDMFKGLTVNLDGASVGVQASKYLAFIKESISKYGPEYVLVSTYACAKLWPYLQRRCRGDIGSMQHLNLVKNNVYSKWCDGGKEPQKQETLIQEYYEKALLKLDVANDMFIEALNHEVAFFNNA